MKSVLLSPFFCVTSIYFTSTSMYVEEFEFVWFEFHLY